ncbi:helix-turn-helix transcriptional regulator [Mycolicibacterium boenickei]|nr:helix-turn-helix transcriptional regulator [Mycolicibacterium boenickei]
MSWDTLAKLTGLSDTALRKLGAWTDQSTVCLDTHQRVMAVPVPRGLVDGGGWVPVVGSQRRIRALMAIGWTQGRIAEETGLGTGRAVSSVLNARTYVSARVAKSISDAFDRLHMTAGPSDLLVRRARIWGWPLPLQWDEDAIDDPDAQPHLIGREETSYPELYLEMRDHLGLSDHQIAAREGIKKQSLDKKLQRHGLSEQRTA